MSGLDELSDAADLEEEEEGVEQPVPDTTGLFENFVSGRETPNFDYSVGILESGLGYSRVQIIGVREIDQQALVAVPDAAWHRTRNRRLLPEDLLQRPVRVEVRCAVSTDRSAADDTASIKVWLGMLKPGVEDQVIYGMFEQDGDVNFPQDDLGLPKLPYAESLVAVAQDHFLFISAESGGQPDGGGGKVEARLASLESNMAEILKDSARQSMAASAPQPSDPVPAMPLPPRTSALKQTQKRRSPSSVAAPPGLDPHIAQQALGAGVTPQALQEIGGLVRPSAPHGPPGKPRARIAGFSTDEDEEDEHLGDGSGSAERWCI